MRLKKCLLLVLFFVSSVVQAFSFSFPTIRSHNIGLDLGTRNSILVTNIDGKVQHLSEEVSAVCFNTRSGEVVCLGQSAIDKIGKCPPGRFAQRVIQNGNIADLNGTRAFLDGMFALAKYQVGYNNPKIVFGVPGVVDAGATLSIREAAKSFGFKEKNIFVVREPVAAAIAEGLPIEGDNASMVVDIGGGTCDIVVLSQFGVLEKSKKPFTIAGDEMDKAIVDYLFNVYKLEISPETAEQVKREFGTVYLDTEVQGTDNQSISTVDDTYKVWGKDPLTKLPKAVTLSKKDMVEALDGCARMIVNEAHEVLARCEDRAQADVAKNGILLVGGGALVPGMQKRLQIGLGVKVNIPTDPLHSVANGIGKILGDLKHYSPILHRPGESF